jgi:hypothetical protein
MYIPYVNGVSEKLKHIGMNITLGRSSKLNTHLGILMKTRPERDLQEMAQCIYIFPCECGRSYIGETGRLLVVGLLEHRQNLKEGLLEKSKLAQHAYEEAHKVGCDVARILEIESNSRYRKY